MGSFDYYRHAERMQGLLDAIADFDCEPLLDLKPAGECLDHPGNFAQAGDFAVRDVGYMTLPQEREHMVLAE